MRGDGIKLDPIAVQQRINNIEGIKKKQMRAQQNGDSYNLKKYDYHLKREQEKFLKLVDSTQVWYK